MIINQRPPEHPAKGAGKDWHQQSELETLFMHGTALYYVVANKTQGPSSCANATPNLQHVGNAMSGRGLVGLLLRE